MKYTLYLILIFTSLNTQAQQQAKFTFRSEIKGIQNVDRAYPLPSTEGAITIRAERGVLMFSRTWRINGFFHSKPANTYTDTPKDYKDVGKLLIDSLEIPKEDRNGYILKEESSIENASSLEQLFGRDIVWKFEANDTSGYEPFSYKLYIPKPLNLKLESLEDTSYKFGNRLSLKYGTTLKWDIDTSNRAGVLISIRAGKYWDGINWLVPGIEYVQNDILVKDDGSYTISEKDLQNIPNDQNVTISVSATRFNKAIVPNGNKHIQLYFEEHEFGIVLFRKD